MLTYFSTLLYSGALSFGNVNIYILLFNGAKSSSGTIENQTEKNDVVNIVHIAVSWHFKMTSLVNKSADWPPNYHKILIFFPTTSLKCLHAARIDELADSNESAMKHIQKPVADLRGGTRDVRPPGGPNSFNFMQFWGKYGKIVCWCPLGSLRPLLGEILDPPLETAS